LLLLFPTFFFPFALSDSIFPCRELSSVIAVVQMGVGLYSPALIFGERLEHNMGVFIASQRSNTFPSYKYHLVWARGVGAADITDRPISFFLVGIIALLSFAFAFHLSFRVWLSLLQRFNSSRKAPGGKFFFCVFYSFLFILITFPLGYGIF